MSDHEITLFGYRFSVYTRVAMLTLMEKGLSFSYVEVDPFQPDLPRHYLGMQPFGRVPAMRHGDLELYETAAITRYLDARFPEPALTPDDPTAIARMQQVIGIVDSHGYRAMVRQVVSNIIFRPLEGLGTDAEELRTGVRESRKVLAALEELAREGRVLNGEDLSLADLHLVPMMDYFRLTDEGGALLSQHISLAAWWERMARRGSTVQTRPDLSTLAVQRD